MNFFTGPVVSPACSAADVLDIGVIGHVLVPPLCLSRLLPLLIPL
jgi:hypothetical protein